MDIFDRLSEDILGFDKRRDASTLEFYAFEPWDVGVRTREVKRLALEDGVDLDDPNFVQHVGSDPHPFQTGYLMSRSFLSVLQAGNQEGKSYAAKIDMLICSTGEIPHSLRYERGVDTKIKRAVTKKNVARWGRRDAVTGTLIDYDEDHPVSAGEWDCGTIIGAGVFPKERILTPGSQIWIGTNMKAMQNYWWPDLTDKTASIIPRFLIDTSRGVEGVSSKDCWVYVTRDCVIKLITYESHYDRFEAKMAGRIYLDEEPPDERIFQAAQQHAESVSLTMTPYHGITYTKRIIFPETRSPEVSVFHATQYDSPYCRSGDIEVRRRNMQPWERAARIWGVHSEAQGAPYFDRTKINGWAVRYAHSFTPIEHIPSDEYHGSVGVEIGGMKLKGLIDINVTREARDSENRKSVWREYEPPKKGIGYVMVVDPAEGDEDPDKAGDNCAAQIWRLAKPGERRPVLCASLDSTLPTIQFARVCGLALRLYNNALLAAETKRGFSNATFASELKDWPYWYKMVTIQDSTRQPRKQIGFDTNAKTRDSMYDLIGKWLDEYPPEEYPMIPDNELLRELAGAVRGKGGRCDHTREGSLDRATCFGILLYIIEHGKDQISDNTPREVRTGFLKSRLSGASAVKPKYPGQGLKWWR